MVRAVLVALLVLGLWPVDAAASHRDVTVKGFVVSRSAAALAIKDINGRMTTVRLTGATAVGGVRASGGEIAIGDLIRAEGPREADGSGDDVILASRVEVLLEADALERSRRPVANSVFWNWMLNGSLSLPVR